MQKEMTPIRIIRFWQEYRLDEKTGDQRAIDMVEYAPVGGAKYSTQKEAIKRLSCLQTYDADNPAIQFAHARWRVIEPQYLAWKDGREVPTEGTPLGAWPGVTQDQAEAFRNAGFKTVEDIANASGGDVQRVPVPSPLGLQKQAKAFLESSDAAAAAKVVKDSQETITAMNEQMEELKQIVLDQQAELEAARATNTKANTRRKNNTPAQAGA